VNNVFAPSFSGTTEETLGVGTLEFTANGVRRILIYGPSMVPSTTFRPDNEEMFAVAEGFTVTVWDSTTWVSKTTADFANYSAIVFGDRGGNVLGAAEANKAVWSAAITGPVIISALNPQIHQCDIAFNETCIAGGPPVHQPQAVTLIKNAINFAASGAGTGAYISLDAHFTGAPVNTPVTFLSEIGAFEVAGIVGPEGSGVGFTDVIGIVATSHPAMAGLSGAGLSNWLASNHQFFQAFPASYTRLAESDRILGEASEKLAVIIACSPGGATVCVQPSPEPPVPGASFDMAGGQNSSLSKVKVPKNIR